MKIRELITQLLYDNTDLDKEVYVWVDGERLEIDSVDANFSDDWYVDINVKAQYANVLVNSDGEEIGEAK
jgi:hypothetical protein